MKAVHGPTIYYVLDKQRIAISLVLLSCVKLSGLLVNQSSM